MFASPWGLRNYDYMRSLGGPVNWVRKLIPRKRRKKEVGLLFIFWWMIGKDRNRRIFESKEILAQVCWELDFCSV
jgi:hypothetical protein